MTGRSAAGDPPDFAVQSACVALTGDAVARLPGTSTLTNSNDERLRRAHTLGLVDRCCAATAAAQQPPPQPGVVWAQLPRMQLERQFAGPLPEYRRSSAGAIRWMGSICYTYLPISAQHTAPTWTGFVQYGPNAIGSISCVGPAATATKPPQPPPRPR